MSASAQSATPFERSQLDDAVRAVKAHSREFARLAPAAKAGLLRECVAKLADAAPAWVATGNKAKRLSAGDAEEWLAGPVVTIRIARLLADSLDAIAARGRPPLGTGVTVGRDGRVSVELFPAGKFDKLLFSPFSGSVLMQDGIDRAAAQSRQAGFYHQRDPEGGVSLILGAGNVSSIPPTDAMSKMFVEGYTCVVKMNPVNEWCGPFLERALSPLITRGYLRIVYGGGDVGAYLVGHELVDDVHITGSDRTHDLIVWGPPGRERDQRMADNEPLLDKPISSELGNVSPVAVVPGDYSPQELWFQAQNVASMVSNNASFNCNAAKMLIVSAGWPQRDEFLSMIGRALDSVPSRLAYYPGAFERYRTLTDGRDVETHGGARGDELPWTLIRNVEPSSEDPLFRTEPFCAILSETRIEETDPIEFLSRATAVMNDELWGTLNACIVLPPRHTRDSAVSAAVDDAVVALRYGTVAINHWPALCYGTGSLPWGGHPSATLQNVQSGLGWVHNTLMLEGVDKSVVRGPTLVKPKPVWFYDHRNGAAVGERLVRLEADPGWLKLPGLILKSL